MNSHKQNNQSEFEKIKDQVKIKIISFLKNELNHSNVNVDNEFLTVRINQINSNVLKNLQNWMQAKIPERYKEFVLKAISEEKWSDLIEAFKQELVFGTSGIRGKLTVSLDEKKSENDLKSLNDFGFASTILRGCNSINEITIMKNICGLINYMDKKNFLKVVIGYDSRVASKLFSRLITNIFLKKNYSVILLDEYTPLPELSFAVTYFNADMGIEITASHNDKRYNGYKLITKSGAPPTNEIREEITKEIFNNKDDIPYELLSFDYRDDLIIFNSEKLTIINNLPLIDFSNNKKIELSEKYLDQIENLIFDKNIVKNFSSKLQIGYSALHGTGYYSVSKLLQKLGIQNVKYISDMIFPDPLFSLFTSKQILDPSDIDAASVVVKAFTKQYSEEEFNQLDVFCYTDPDADRLGVIIKVPDAEKSIYGKWKLLKANDVWTLFLWYILETFVKNTETEFSNLNKLFIVKSFVTSDSLLYISKKYNIECIDGKVGFSDLTDIVRRRWKQNKINMGIFEESCGYGFAGNHESISLKMHILEKDAMLSLTLLIEILCYAKSQNLSILDLLNNIYLDNKIGFFATHRKELPEKGVFEGIRNELYLIHILKNVENFCITINEKIKNNESFMICGIPISSIEKFSTGRYDVKFWKDFPDEGIRFYLDSKTNHITIRSSGTEPKLRIFVQYRISSLDKNNIFEKKLYVENLVKQLSDQIEKLILM